MHQIPVPTMYNMTIFEKFLVRPYFFWRVRRGTDYQIWAYARGSPMNFLNQKVQKGPSLSSTQICSKIPLSFLTIMAKLA